MTIRDVAAAAGVSVGTVSRALNKKGRVSKSAISAVAEAASRLGYEPDAIAQSMRQQSTKVVGMLISDVANPFFASVIRAAETRLRKAGYVLLIGNTDNDARRESELVDMFRRRRVDGMILGPCESDNAELLEQLNRSYFPSVAFDRSFVSGGGVHVDHRKGAQLSTRFLLNLGHERIALMSSSDRLRPGRERIEGFRTAHDDAGIEVDPKLIFAEPFAMEFVFSEALSLVNSPNPPTAYICLGTRILAGVLQALKQAGKRVPEDASVISIGDSDLARLHAPAITAISWDLEMVGEVLAEVMLKRLMPETEVGDDPVTVSTHLIQRNSCAPLARRLAVKGS
ncbi:MAG: substrate-binding domain-containing protein [Pseudomonadota bacterium]|nr:substrate-binding domain-containing protein [Pseudomonadota bacterium]